MTLLYDFSIVETSGFFVTPVLITYMSETVLRILSNQMAIKVVVSIINSDKLSRSYDDLYFGDTFWDTGHRVFRLFPKLKFT